MRTASVVITVLIAVVAWPSLAGNGRLNAAVPVSVDLSTYVRVGRFDLPEPTRTSAPANSLLAQEASGVTYDWDTDTLFVVGDGGTSVVQVTKTGALIDSMTLAQGSSPQGTEFYDTEGISYVGSGKFVLIEERYRQVNLFTYVAGATLHRADVKTVKLGTTIGNIGLEGISYDPLTGGFILVKEKDPESVFQTGIDFNAGTATNGSPSATGSTDLFAPPLANLADFSDVFALSNLPSLQGQPDFNRLLIISQESGQILSVDRSGNVSSRLTIVADPGSPLSVPDMTMEGVTMDRDGFLYVVNENGGGDANHPQLWVYAHSDAPNHAPTALTLLNTVSALPENTSTAAPIRLADIVVVDDGLGANNLTLGGGDAASFQIVGAALYLRAGTHLSSSAKPVYNVLIVVDDPTVGTTPDATAPFALTVTASTGGTPTLIISEVAAWSSGNSPVGDDWFEVTNIGTAAANIAGWRVDDNSNSFGSSIALNGVATIAPGESVIFIETSGSHTAAGNAANFRSLWFGSNPPPGLQIGNYGGSGIGLSTGGDAVNLYNGAGVLQASVTFGVSASGPFASFDNAAGLNSTAISTFSAVGVNGAFVAANDRTEIGSPGTIGAPATPVVTITAPDPDASEAGSDPGTFRIARAGSTAGALSVSYVIGSGAGQASGADYTPALTGVVTIPPGQNAVDITVTPVDDDQFEGPETITLTLFDSGSYDVGSPKVATVTIADNDPPDTAIDSGPAAATAATSARFTFSGSEPVSALARFECSLDGAPFSVCTSPIIYSGLGEGTHTFAVRAVDRAGHVDPTPASFTWIVDLTPPVISIGATVPVLWPPNGKLVPDTILGRITDALSGIDPQSLAFTVIDEYGQVQPAGAISIDSDGRYAFVAALEAARAGSDRDGRRYDVVVSARDQVGNQSSATTIVVVPHDQGK